MGRQEQSKGSRLVAPGDDRVARDVAEEAGQLLLEVRQSLTAVLDFDSKRLRDEGDRRSHILIVERMAQLRPDDAILSEEGKDDLARLEFDRVWIIDPLDGTREFGEPPRQDWAVHVALCVQGIPAAGAVALPAQNRVFSTGGTIPELPAPGRRPRIAVSRSRAPSFVADLASALDGEIVYMGSAGAKAMAILSGDVDIYVHAGGQYEWDSAAPVAVAAFAGLHCSRVDGSALRFNRPEPYLPDLLICRPELARSTLDVLQVSLAQAAQHSLSTEDVEGGGV